MKKVLYVSGSLGLGHVTRDLAIARELRKVRPDVEILWLTSEPASTVLRTAGENLVEGAETYQSNTTAAEDTANGFRVNLAEFVLHENKAWKETFERFKVIVARERPDLVIGDEAGELAVNMVKDNYHGIPRTLMIFDFMKWYSMTNRPVDKLAIWMVNRYWQFAYERRADWKGINCSVLLGDEDDVPDERLGMFLMNARDCANEVLVYVSEIVRFDPKDYQDQKAIRKKLGYDDGPLIVCSIGGTNIGRPLLELCSQAYPLLKKDNPNLKMVLVGGPRIDPNTIDVPEGVEVKGYVPDLYEHFAAADLAIVQCGGTTTLELMALQKPFLYFPLEEHFEQLLSVAGKLKRHGANGEMRFYDTTPEKLAQAVRDLLGKKVEYRPVDAGAEKRIAEIAKGML